MEKEAFLVDEEGNPQIVPPHIPHDDEGIQIEYRGNPYNNFIYAYASLEASEYSVNREILREKLGSPLVIPYIKVPRDTKLKLRRMYNKGTLKYENIYGYKRHKVSSNVSTAGIHISITNQIVKPFHKLQNNVIFYDNFIYNAPWDFNKFIRDIDSVFSAEIKKAKRNLGFYEIKNDGRIEYRSLPNDVSKDKLIEFMMNYKFSSGVCND